MTKQMTLSLTYGQIFLKKFDKSPFWFDFGFLWSQTVASTLKRIYRTKLEQFLNIRINLF